jgi:CopG family nickel-responsive transcriptional regulator
LDRFTISLDSELAEDFDALISLKGYANRSEAVRDLIRQALESSRQSSGKSKHAVAVVSYVYNHHEKTMAERITNTHHEHHDLVVSSTHVHLDHDNCLEAVFLKGKTEEVTHFANHLTAMAGVRHGSMNLISADIQTRKHSHALHGTRMHYHLMPKN